MTPSDLASAESRLCRGLLLALPLAVLAWALIVGAVWWVLA